MSLPLIGSVPALLRRTDSRNVLVGLQTFTDYACAGHNRAMGISTRKSNLQKFVELDGSKKRLLLRAVLWLGYARILLTKSSFRDLSTKLSKNAAEQTGDADERHLQDLSWAIAVAANNIPWRSDCFPQSIAAALMLRRAGHSSTIHFGVSKVTDVELAGHAWLTCGESVVTGANGMERYTEVHQLNV